MLPPKNAHFSTKTTVPRTQALITAKCSYNKYIFNDNIMIHPLLQDILTVLHILFAVGIGHGQTSCYRKIPFVVIGLVLSPTKGIDRSVWFYQNKIILMERGNMPADAWPLPIGRTAAQAGLVKLL